MSMIAWDDVNKRFIRVQADANGILKTKPEGVYLAEDPALVDGEQHRLTLTSDGRLRVGS